MMRLFYLLFFVFVCQAMHTNQIQPIKGIQKDTVVKRARDNYDPTRAKINATEGTTNEDITITDASTAEATTTEATTTERTTTESTTREETITETKITEPTTTEATTTESTTTEATTTEATTTEPTTTEATTTEATTTDTKTTESTTTEATTTDTTTTEATTTEPTTTEGTTPEETTTEGTTTDRTTTERTIDYLVSIRSSNVPSADYQYDAVGILQVLLDETRSMATALPQFLKEFQSKHDSHIWKLSHACTILLLPNGVVYMELYEHATGTTIYLFE